MVHTGCLGLAIADTFSDGLLAASPLDASSVDADSLLVLVAQSAGLVWSGRSENISVSKDYPTVTESCYL